MLLGLSIWYLSFRNLFQWTYLLFSKCIWDIFVLKFIKLNLFKLIYLKHFIKIYKSLWLKKIRIKPSPKPKKPQNYKRKAWHKKAIKLIQKLDSINQKH